MAAMVVLSVGSRFLPGGPGGRRRGEAQGHDPRDRYGRPRWRSAGDAAAGLGAWGHRQAGRRRHDSRRRAAARHCKDLFVSQGSLTGESLPVEKFHEPGTGRREFTHRTQEHLFYGDQRRKRHGYGRRSHDRGPHLPRQHGAAPSPESGRRPASIRASTASPGS